MTTRRYFLGPDDTDQPALWFGTPDEHAPRLVATEGPTAGAYRTSVPAELFRLIATVLAPTDEDVDQLARVLAAQHHPLGAWDHSAFPEAAREDYRAKVRAVLRTLASGVLA